MAKTKQCDDSNCPKHHGLSTHGRTFTGTVIDTKSARTVTVQWERQYFLPKYERYERRYTKMHVHSPACADIKKGDIVRVDSCRKLSKTKSHVVTEKLGSDYAFLAREELLLQAETPEKEKKAAEVEKNESA